MKGEAGIAEIAKVLEENRGRKDVGEAEIGKTCVKALGETRSSEALPVLEAELQWVSKQEVLPGYGLELIEAVGDVGDSRGAVMLERYADEIKAKLAGDPVIRRSQLLQIAEALDKAGKLR